MTICRVSFADHYASILASAAAVQTAGPLAANRLLDREAHNVLALVGWVLDARQKPQDEAVLLACLPALTQIAWDGMQLLGLRLDPHMRITFCEVKIPN